MLTGEPVPVIKQPGDLVTTLNSQAIALRATRLKRYDSSSNCRFVAAQTRKAPVQKLADTVAGTLPWRSQRGVDLIFGTLSAAMSGLMCCRLWLGLTPNSPPAPGTQHSIHRQTITVLRS